MTETKQNHGFRILLFLVIAVIFLSGVCAGFLLWLNQPTRLLAGGDQAFTISKGESIHSIAARLAGEGIIKSSVLIRLLVKVLKTETLFKAGAYSIPLGSTVLDIHDLFVSGTQTIIKFTIPEGYTLSRIGQKLEEKSILLSEDFTDLCSDKEYLASFGIPGPSAEGFLFPDTYFLSDAMTATDIVNALIRNFYAKLGDIYPDFEKLSTKELYDKIILASIVEREYRRPEEAAKIASVFYNRMKINMGLGSCATIEYIITEIEGKPHPEVLRKEDLEIRSPYNTYMWAGLPPAPISNPGAVALRAVFYPEKTDFMYFLLKNPSTGEHIFTTDIEGHNKAKYLYLKQVP